MALAAVLRCKPGKTYAASVWVRANRPGTLVEVNLLEVVGGRRYATDSVGAVLEGGDWERVEVTHLAHRLGAPWPLRWCCPGARRGPASWSMNWS
jgi:hypothetical protein